MISDGMSAAIFSLLSPPAVQIDGLGTRYVIIGIMSILFIIMGRAVEQWYHSPLRRIPGPWPAAISNMYLIWHTLRKDAHEHIITLHNTYGTTVRMGPNEMYV